MPAGAIDHLEHRDDQARCDLFDFDHAAQLGQRREDVGKARNPYTFVSKWKARAVTCKHPARIGRCNLGLGHLRDNAFEPAHPGQVVIVSDDDLAVASHVDIEFDIWSAGRGGGAE